MVKKCSLFLAIALSAVLFLLILIGDTASAATTGSWARVTADGVYLYADETAAKPLFMLEKSYYVRIADVGEDMLYVSVLDGTDFPTIMGWVRRSQLQTVSVEPLSPTYPTVEVTVTSGGAALKLTPVPSAETIMIAANSQKLRYYGTMDSYGQSWYCVMCGDVMGYVSAAAVSAPVIAPHPTPLSKPASSLPTTAAPSETATDKKRAAPATEILLTVFVAALAAGLTLALFLPGNTKHSAVFEVDI